MILRLAYKPFGLLVGVVSGIVAGMVFKRVWRLVSSQPEPPSATRANRSWSEVLLAAGLEGAIYALVKAAVERASAVSFEKATGQWPGEEDE
jgi:hypothetical protein